MDWQGHVFFSLNVEEMLPKDAPIRDIKRRADRILASMDDLFRAAYKPNGRSSIPPEQMLKAMLLRALHSIPSEIKLMEAIRWNMLHRWFLDMPLDAQVWTPETFSMNRERFERHGLVRAFFEGVVKEAIIEDYASCDHFSVDGTLIRSLASVKSLERVEEQADEEATPADTKPQPNAPHDEDPGNPSINFRNERRTNKTHRSRTDSQARLYRKGRGQPAFPTHLGHAMMENRNGLVVDVCVTEANGLAEREAALGMARNVRRRFRKLRVRTLGMDSGYDDGRFLRELEQVHGIVPHVPVRRGAIKGTDAFAQARRKARQRSRNVGWIASQRRRKRIEEVFGWCKTVAGQGRARHVGRWKIEQELRLAAASYNLLRLATLSMGKAWLQQRG
jgi:transposase